MISPSCYLTDSGSPYLTEAQVSLIDTAECNRSIAYSGRISPDMFCAREMEAAADMCRVRRTSANTHTRIHCIGGVKHNGKLVIWSFIFIFSHILCTKITHSVSGQVLVHWLAPEHAHSEVG